MPKLTKAEIDENWDEFLAAYYLQECPGCKDGHSSFWRTIIMSEEWKDWQKVGQYDFSECNDLGIMSKKHWEDFVKFIKYEKRKSQF